MRDVLLRAGRFLHMRTCVMRGAVCGTRIAGYKRRGQPNQSQQESEVCYAFHQSFHPEPSYSIGLANRPSLHRTHRNSLEHRPNFFLPGCESQNGTRYGTSLFPQT
jgi:hypothetical protein